MRKRKSPIVLITLLVVVVAGVTGFNFASSKPGGNPADAPPAPTPPSGDAPKAIGDPRPKESTSSVSGDVNALIAKTGKPSMAPTKMPGGPGGPGESGSGPMILNPSRAVKQEKPKPNTSSTSAQWYNDESALSKDKG